MVQLTYVTRDPNDDDYDGNAIESQVPLNGPKFDRDSKQVLLEFQALVKDSEGMRSNG